MENNPGDNSETSNSPSSEDEQLGDEVSDTPSNLGRKKVRKEHLWKKNQIKLKKNSGKSYKSHSGKEISSKTFHSVKECCLKTCFKNVSIQDQLSFFSSFWKSGNKNLQDNIIAQSLVGCKPKRKTTDCKYSERVSSWKYEINVNGCKYSVCRMFFLRLLQVSPKRVRIIQQKLNKGDVIVEDKRGKHSSRPNKISCDVWKLVEEHWESIPNSPSHYSAEKSKLNYFENPDLDIKKLYEMFQQFFFHSTGSQLKMKYATYHRYFREKSKYAFRKPRTDMCDFCSKCSLILKENPDDPCKVRYNIHLKKYERYKEIKSEILGKCLTDESLLALEFDFAQNRPLPKLEVNSVFYKRLLWMYIFNLHCHNNNKSAMYWFLESEGEKNCNAVCSFLYHFISENLSPSVKKVVLFSDATGGQNKSIKVVYFLAWLSKQLNIEIEHIYPVRGHSYCVCDRNFGLYSQKMKRIQTIETVDTYVKVLAEARSSPFPYEVIHGASLLKNWYSMLSPFMLKKPITKKSTWAIQKYPVIKYKHGIIQAFISYMDICIPFKVIKKKTNFEELNSDVPEVRVKENKLKDLKVLMDFLSLDGKEWFQEHVFQLNN